MLRYEKINVSEGIDINRANTSKECMLCHYWYFKNIGFNFQPNLFNKCQNVLITACELKKNCNIKCKTC